MEFKPGQLVMIGGVVYTFLRINKFHGHMAVLQRTIDGESYIEHSYALSQLTPVEMTNKRMTYLLERDY